MGASGYNCPSWVVIGILLVVPVLIMFVYSFLTQGFPRWRYLDVCLEAYDQFFIDRGLFGDEPAQLEWTYIMIFWRSFLQALFAMIFCLLIGFPTAYFMATSPPKSRSFSSVFGNNPVLGQFVDPHCIDEISYSGYRPY